MDIIEEIKEKEKMYKKGMIGVESKNETMKKAGKGEKDSLFIRSTVSFDYFTKYMAKKFPDMLVVRVINVKSDYTPCYEDSVWYNYYNIEYVMMSKETLEIIRNRENNLVFLTNKGYVICDYFSDRKKEKLEKDEILAMCPIILLYKNKYCDERRLSNNFYPLKELTQATFPDIISLYPQGTYCKSDKTRFLLCANNSFVEQRKLDNICMSMLSNLNKMADSDIDKEISIYEKIREKLKVGKLLDTDEWELIQKFLNEEEDRIRSKHTILKKSLVRKEDKE